METPETDASPVSPEDIAVRIQSSRSGYLADARMRGHESRLNAEDEIFREVIAALEEHKLTEWAGDSKTCDTAAVFVAEYQAMILENEQLRENKAAYPDLSPGDTARQDQIRAAVENDKLGVLKLACLLCYAMEALPQTGERHGEIWLDAAESLKDDIAEAEKLGGCVSEDLSSAIQMPIDDSYFRFYVGTMFNSTDDIGNEIAGMREGVSAAIQQAAVCSLIIGTPAEATEEICRMFRISEEEAERLLDTTDAKT